LLRRKWSLLVEEPIGIKRFEERNNNKTKQKQVVEFKMIGEGAL